MSTTENVKAIGIKLSLNKTTGMSKSRKLQIHLGYKSKIRKKHLWSCTITHCLYSCNAFRLLMLSAWNQTSTKCQVRSFVLKLLIYLLKTNKNANMLANLRRSSWSGNPCAHEVIVLHFWSMFGALKSEKTSKSVWNKNFWIFLSIWGSADVLDWFCIDLLF